MMSRGMLVLWILAGLFVAGLLIVRFWLSYDEDWLRVEREAKAAGFTFQVSEAVPATDFLLRSRLSALETIARSVTASLTTTLGEVSVTGRTMLRAELAKCPGPLAALEHGVDELTGRCGGGQYDGYNVSVVLGARIRSCPVGELDACISRMSHLLYLTRGTWNSLGGGFLFSCSLRTTDLCNHWVAAAVIENAFADSVNDLLLFQRSSLAADAETAHDTSSWKDSSTVLGHLLLRRERESWLRDSLTAILATRQDPDPAHWPARFRYPDAPSPASLTALHLHRGLSLERFAGYWELICTRRLLYARLLSAEIRGATWPVDVFDPTGRRLRRIERGGVLIGAYSVGGDGLDQGGDRKLDTCFRLYQALGMPKASDPLPADPVVSHR